MNTVKWVIKVKDVRKKMIFRKYPTLSVPEDIPSVLVVTLLRLDKINQLRKLG